MVKEVDLDTEGGCPFCKPGSHFVTVGSINMSKQWMRESDDNAVKYDETTGTYSCNRCGSSFHACVGSKLRRIQRKGCVYCNMSKTPFWKLAASRFKGSAVDDDDILVEAQKIEAEMAVEARKTRQMELEELLRRSEGVPGNTKEADSMLEDEVQMRMDAAAQTRRAAAVFESAVKEVPNKLVAQPWQRNCVRAAFGPGAFDEGYDADDLKMFSREDLNRAPPDFALAAMHRETPSTNILTMADEMARIKKAAADRAAANAEPNPCPSCGSLDLEVVRDGGSFSCRSCRQLFHRCRNGTVGPQHYKLGGPGPMFCPDCARPGPYDVPVPPGNPPEDAMTAEWRALGYIK